jgi:hypothetical protein
VQVSRLTAPGGLTAGGVRSYQEYCREVYEREGDDARAFSIATVELSRNKAVVRG